MAPTAVRVVKKEDYDGLLIKKFDTSTINSFALVGERCDPDTIKWIHLHFPHVLINDTWFAFSNFSRGTRFGTDASLAGDQNKVMHSTKIIAV